MQKDLFRFDLGWENNANDMKIKFDQIIGSGNKTATEHVKTSPQVGRRDRWIHEIVDHIDLHLSVEHSLR